MGVNLPEDNRETEIQINDQGGAIGQMEKKDRRKPKW